MTYVQLVSSFVVKGRWIGSVGGTILFCYCTISYLPVTIHFTSLSIINKAVLCEAMVAVLVEAVADKLPDLLRKSFTSVFIL